ncbi:MAG TPA: DNA repair protein RecO [Terriglobia bacterium]|nr:DNA repair protein RecO [Terriglobia bacterium]
MSVLHSDAIILRTYPLGEADRIVVFFSRDHGKMRGVANGARRMKNRFGASLEPLAHSRIVFTEKENRELVRIQSADLLDSPMRLFADYDRAVVAGHLVDLMDRFMPERQPHDAVFRLVRMTAEALENGRGIDFVSCYFDVWMLRLAGVFPDLFTCSSCGVFMRPDGERFLAAGLEKAVCGACDRGENVTVHPEAFVALDWILRNRLDADSAPSAETGFVRGTRNLHELNQYWIRHYLER